MTTLLQADPLSGDRVSISREESAIAFPEFIPADAQSHLARMFRDPYLLEKQERTELVKALREAVAFEPAVPELRVLLGMALCVNFEAQNAMEELKEAVRLAPDSYIAHLKLGELMMRLRICSQAEAETRLAAELASNALQSELARRQAATIRKMIQEGVERGGYGKLLSFFSRAGRVFAQRRNTPALSDAASGNALIDSNC